MPKLAGLSKKEAPQDGGHRRGFFGSVWGNEPRGRGKPAPVNGNVLHGIRLNLSLSLVNTPSRGIGGFGMTAPLIMLILALIVFCGGYFGWGRWS